MKNQKTIFISYGRDKKNPQDIELVRKIKQDLEAQDFKVLMDEEQLKTGSDWEITLENMIKQSDWILFFITPYSARRPDGYCLNELTMSLSYGKSIAPIMINYEVLPLSICRLQYLDLQTLTEEEYDKKLNEIISVINDDTKLSFEGEHLGVLNILKPIKFETTISKYSYGFVGREWVTVEVNKWLEEDESKVLWLKAEAGFGKTAISTYLATKHPFALGIHFCQYDYKESQNAKEMLKVLIFQLATQLSEYHNILQDINIKEELKESPVHIFTQLLLDPLNQIKQPEEKQFFIIDALDEAEKDGKNEIVELISNRFGDLPSWLKIIVTSRDEASLDRKLKKVNPIKLKSNKEENIQDLKNYLKEQQRINNSEIIETLIEKSEGNILYLKSMFELEIIRKDEIDLEILEQFPNSIESFYLTYFERKFEDIEIYEKEYLDFVSLLVSQQDMPELLIKDILKISDRKYNKIKEKFGSLLDMHEDNISFYHKTIYEWLRDFNISGEYSADLEKGSSIYESFLDNLTEESYKEEYLKFEVFNRDIINLIFVQDGNSSRFFRMLSLIDDEIKINKIRSLSGYYPLNNKRLIYEDIHKRLFKEIKELYDKNRKPWEKHYINSLLNLAFSYKNTYNCTLDAIKLEEEALNILEILYKEDSTQWVEEYTRALTFLAVSYDNIGRHADKFILEEKSLSIREDKYNINPKKWAEDYTVSLTNLAISYYEYKKIPKAIELHNKSLKIRKKYYDNEPEKWLRHYTFSLSSLALCYRDTKQIPKALRLAEKSQSIIEEYYNNNPDRWVEEYIIILNYLATIYNKKSIDKAIELGEKCLKIVEELIENDYDKWIMIKENCKSNLEQYYKILEMKQNSFLKANIKPKRNEPCPCKSGKKYKKCCAQK